MHQIKLQNKILLAEDGELLSHVLQKYGISVPHPCGGTGKCGKCMLLVDGKKQRSCRYPVRHNISLILPNDMPIESQSDAKQTEMLTEEMCYVLDIGTTTLALALVSLDKKQVVRVVTQNNPQRAFGADVMSRIAYCQTNPQGVLHTTLTDTVRHMVASFGISQKLKMFVAGNVTMLHLFFDMDCRGIGTAPYTPLFLDGKKTESFIDGVSQIESLPAIHSFIGADIVAGIYHVGMPSQKKYNLLLDLGTNAEIVLFSNEKILCTSAAAGPCFEGANIVCGTGAITGAICEAGFDNGKLTYQTIGNASPIGICGTGLVDIIAALLSRGIIDRTGFLEDESYPITDTVYLDASDIRQFQLAKSAIYSAVLSLLRIENISFSDVQTLYLAGGFSTKINIPNAAAVGLFPRELAPKSLSVGNSSLLGTIKYALEKDILPPYTTAQYIDLAATEEFSRLFMENMMF